MDIVGLKITMVTASGHVFVGDFVSFNINGVALIGRVLKFFMKECT